MGRSRKRKNRSSGCGSEGEKDRTCKNIQQGGPSGGELAVSELLNKTNSVLYDTGEEELSFVSDNVFGVLVQDCGETLQGTEMASGGVAHQVTESAQPSNSDIMACLRQIEGRLSRMDKRLDALEEVKAKVDSLDKDMKKMWVFIEDKTKKLDEKVGAVEEKVESCDFALAITNEKVVSLEKERDALRNDIVYLQSQSMRNNLIFGNIEEAGEGVIEDCEVTIRKFMGDKLRVAEDLVQKLSFDRVHRMGQRQVGRNRRIVAKFHEYKDKEYVRKQWKALQGTPYFISEQFPKEVMDKRRLLLPKMKDAKKEGKRAWLAYDTLYIDGRPVRD